MKLLRLILFIFLLAAAAPTLKGQGRNTIYETLGSDIATTGTFQISEFNSIGQSQHDATILFTDAPSMTCNAGAVTAFFQATNDQTDATSWRRIGIVASQSIDDGSSIQARVRADGAFPFIRLNLSAFDTTNCRAQIFYAGTLFPFAFQAQIPEFVLTGLATAQVNINTLGDNTIVSGTAGLQICVYEVNLWNVAQKTFSFKSGAATTLSGPYTNFPGLSGFTLANAGQVHFCADPGDDFIINLGTASDLNGHITYRQE